MRRLFHLVSLFAITSADCRAAMPVAPEDCRLDQQWVREMAATFMQTRVAAHWDKPFRLLTGCRTRAWIVKIDAVVEIEAVSARSGEVGSDALGWHVLSERIARTSVAPDGEPISILSQPEEWVRTATDGGFDWRAFVTATAVHELMHQRQIPTLLEALGQLQEMGHVLPEPLDEKSVFKRALLAPRAGSRFAGQIDSLRKAVIAPDDEAHAALVQRACDQYRERSETNDVFELEELFTAMEGWASFEQVGILRRAMPLSRAVDEVAGGEDAQTSGLLAALALARRDPSAVERARAANFMLSPWEELCPDDAPAAVRHEHRGDGRQAPDSASPPIGWEALSRTFDQSL